MIVDCHSYINMATATAAAARTRMAVEVEREPSEEVEASWG